tara:strand:+ start:1279 stop:1695 length:417 start_codon:yes stop_codon:yes gene_type:complete
MSYNRTNKIHNPFEGKELKKGKLREPLRLAKHAIADMKEADTALALAAKHFRTAGISASESASMLELLSTRVGNVTMSLDKDTRNELRKLAKTQDTNAAKLKAIAKLLMDTGEKSPFYKALNVAVVLEKLDKSAGRKR